MWVAYDLDGPKVSRVVEGAGWPLLRKEMEGEREKWSVVIQQNT